MEEGRWLSIFLKEEGRKIMNSMVSELGRMVVRVLVGVGDNDRINRFLVKDSEILQTNPERGVKVKSDQRFQKNWKKIAK